MATRSARRSASTRRVSSHVTTVSSWTLESTIMIAKAASKGLRLLAPGICLLCCQSTFGAGECCRPGEVQVTDEIRTICASETPELISTAPEAEKIVVGSLKKQDSTGAPGALARLGRAYNLKVRVKLALARQAGRALLHGSDAVLLIHCSVRRHVSGLDH